MQGRKGKRPTHFEAQPGQYLKAMAVTIGKSRPELEN